MKPLVSLYKLGTKPYLPALKIQNTLFERLREHSDIKAGFKKPPPFLGSQTNTSNEVPFSTDNVYNSLVLLEHSPVYTIGIRSREYDQNYVTELKRSLAEHKLNAEVVKTSRGGLITFHGPGQLVVYPILHLGNFRHVIQKNSVRLYVRKLEETIVDTLARLGIKNAHTVCEYPGVWLDNGDRKVAFIGISCRSSVTMHGIAINCDCDLSWYNHIVSCGIKDKSITSIKKELASCPYLKDMSSVAIVADAFSRSFEDHFKCKLVPQTTIKLGEIK